MGPPALAPPTALITTTGHSRCSASGPETPSRKNHMGLTRLSSAARRHPFERRYQGPHETSPHSAVVLRARQHLDTRAYAWGVTRSAASKPALPLWSCH